MGSLLRVDAGHRGGTSVLTWLLGWVATAAGDCGEGTGLGTWESWIVVLVLPSHVVWPWAGPSAILTLVSSFIKQRRLHQVTSKGLFSLKIYDSGIASPSCLPAPFLPWCTGAVEFIDPWKSLSPTSPSSTLPLPLGASFLQGFGGGWGEANRYNEIFSFQLLGNLTANWCFDFL